VLVYCNTGGCWNTVHCCVDGVALCALCIDRMASASEGERERLRAALCDAGPFVGPEWVCEVCGIEWDSFHMLNGICLDCRAVMPYLFVAG
jgi:hypothetical protein